MARWPLSARIGLALILIGIAWFGGWYWWDATRIWVPLDVPVSLSRGHIRAPEFKINVESKYAIEIQAKPGFDDGNGPCFGGYWCQSPLSMSWSLSSGGRVVPGSGEPPLGSVVGSFNARKGSYVLDLDVVQDGSRFDAGAPRLVVFESGDEYGASNDMGGKIFLLSVLMAVLGIYLVVRAAVYWRRERLAALARSWSLTRTGPQPRNLGMVREPPVALANPTRFRPPASAWVGAALVVAGLAAFALVQHWIDVLVDADVPVSLLWQWAVRAIDIIRGQHAEAILLTPADTPQHGKR